MRRPRLSQLLPEASRALCEILDTAHGPLQAPIRAELFGPQRFARHGRSLGATHRAERGSAWAPTFFPRVRNNIRMLAQAHRYIGLQAASGYDVSPAAEWLLDNFHLVEQQLKEIREGLPRSYFRALPLLQDAPLAGLPRIYGVAWAFVAHTDGAFDDDLLTAFLDAYQDTRELTQSELWALPTTLRVVLIEALRRLAERVAVNKGAREVAHLVCDHLERHGRHGLSALLALLEARGAGQAFLVQMAARLQDRRLVGAAEAQAWLQGVLPDPAAAQIQQQGDQAADNLSVSNALGSLRAIGDADWPVLIARTSRLMGVLLASPVFEAEDPATRGHTLHAIERLARRSGRSEVDVARTLLAMMQAGPGDGDAGVPALASHWLRGPGRPALLRALGLHERVAGIARGLARRWSLSAYLGVIAAASLGLSVGLLTHRPADRHGPALPTLPALPALPALPESWPLLALLALLVLLPASEAVLAVVNRLISESLRPRPLPRLALAEGIPAAHRVLVAVPAMLSGTAGTTALVHRLRLHHLANAERHAQFALLTDWADAATEHSADDAPLLDQARALVDGLNTAHPAAPGEPLRFLLLHRPRRFSASERCWIGWERKRGKLEQLVALLAEGTSGAFVDLGALSRPAAGTRYIVTLDSDTQLPPGRLRALVGVAAHPDNTPRLAADGRSVLRGWAILQPRLATPLPTLAERTLFHGLFAGQCGIDPYSAASSEVYQDLFGEGTFTGKGLLHVAAVHAVLAGRLPEDRVLSHDLLEGALARCALVSDLTLVEDAPFHADVAASRVARWMRGDWQLLPFLLQPRRWPLRPVNRWKMADNLRRSLVAPASLVLLVLALAGVGLTPGAALLLVAAAYGAGPLLGAVAGLAPSRDDLARRHFFRLAGADLLRALLATVWHLVQLLQQARLAAGAIGRALYRLLVSHRGLLQWTTAATAQARARTGFGAVWRRHRAEPAIALALGTGLVLAGTPHPLLAGLACLLWAASPLWTWAASRPGRGRRPTVLSAADRAEFESIARDTWRLFERCVGPADRQLPPDNLQVLPHEMLAHRTSPTNIGLYLLSAACARSFGWIGTGELLARLGATLDSVDTLERHHGHLLNWYDTETGAPLLPKYVSTVDSGNLSGHLLAVAQACLALARQPEESAHAPGLQAMAQRCTGQAWQPDYGFLYHRKRRLLHIGWRVAEQTLDPGFYDLLASESRLTSLLAIAKGDVPVSHWSALGRPFFAAGTAVGLRSWSGSMFEYLMPGLVLDEPPGSVLHAASCAALREQVAFARIQGVPWGISESASAAADHTLAYQYAPQGVPRLALRRTPADELVVAPYATALAAPLAPRLALRNFAALQALGARRSFGFIEAVDFTPNRRTQGHAGAPVATFMAHHQGMSIVALANLLHDGLAQRWGMADPHLEAVSSLLHERVPREVSTLHAPPSGPAPQALARRAPSLLRELRPGATALAPTHLLSNGRYSITLRPNGAGTSRRGAVDLARWRDDALRDAHGSFCFLRWQGRAAGPPGAARAPGPAGSTGTPGTPDKPLAMTPLVSITQHPLPDPDADYRCTFHADRVVFNAEWPALQASTTVWVSPEDDIAFRQVELRNDGDAPLTLELVSAFEVALSDARADEAHPAFMNLFVAAEWRPGPQALVFTRTPRLPSEPALSLAHFLADGDADILAVRLQTDRRRWLGRNRGDGPLLAELDPAPPATTAGPIALDTGLDPVCVLAVRLALAPGAKKVVTFATAASDDPAQLQAMVDKYRQRSHVQRASLMSATLAGIRLRALRITPESFGAAQTLTTALVLGLSRPAAPAAGTEVPVVPTSEAAPAHPRSPAKAPTAPTCDRRLLWRFGLSGERPILLVTASTVPALGLLRTLAQVLRLWAWGGVACDLVLLDAEPASYQRGLAGEMASLRDRHAADSAAWPMPDATRLHLLRAEDLSAEELGTLQALARVQLQADGRPLVRQVLAWSTQHDSGLREREEMAAMPVGMPPATPPQNPQNPQNPQPGGRFDAASGEFRFEAGPGHRTPRPWINVLANPQFGTQVSESGGGHSWALNSRLNQLTAWSNDPVADPPAEWCLLQDLKNHVAWSVAPSGWGADGRPHEVAHGQGYTVIRHRRGDLAWTATWCVDPDTAVKQLWLQLHNHGPHALTLRLVGLAEWQLGAGRGDRRTVHTAAHRLRWPGHASVVLMAHQRERSAGLGEGHAFLALPGADDWTCDRREFFDARGALVLPDHLGQRQGDGLDPCAALSAPIHLAAGATTERVLLLGWAESPAAALQLALRAVADPAAARLARVRAHWEALLGATTVRTPDPLFDALVNRWLLYQTVACRLWARAGFYQAGGATGFRDQLQDAMALHWAAPRLLRQQIVLCASRQFTEGDVQHWWHAPGGAGVRTHFSDDLLWLPLACLHYLQHTGDTGLLDEPVSFLEGPPVPDGAEDLYDTPRRSAMQATVYEHAARTLDRSLRVGRHGLPLMGTGDWNDGMNRVGHLGRGESVWLAWFLCPLVAGFAPLARARGEADRARLWEAAAEGWQAALEGPGWDGQWYRRAFFDDGQALGSHANAEARIDLIAQAWAVLSEVAPPVRQRQAMAAAERHLADHEAGLLRLLHPPLAHAEPSPGYIQAYPPGVRENGGQYSHAGVWALMAQARLAQGEDASAQDIDAPYRSFTWLSPAHRSAHPTRGPVYGLEPYAVAGDVYTQPPRTGQGGWSWYTGAAAWLHRAALESILGLQLDATGLCLRPCLPTHWSGAELRLERDGRSLRFVLVRGEQAAAQACEDTPGARTVQPGERLPWPAAGSSTCWVVPLPPVGQPARTASAATMA